MDLLLSTPQQTPTTHRPSSTPANRSDKPTSYRNLGSETNLQKNRERKRKKNSSRSITNSISVRHPSATVVHLQHRIAISSPDGTPPAYTSLNHRNYAGRTLQPFPLVVASSTEAQQPDRTTAPPTRAEANPCRSHETQPCRS